MAAPSKKLDDAVFRYAVAELPRWAGVALAARNAMRAAPLFIPDKARAADDARRDLESVEICQVLAALAATSGTPSDARVAEEAFWLVMGAKVDLADQKKPSFVARQATACVAIASTASSISSPERALADAFNAYELAFVEMGHQLGSQDPSEDDPLILAREAARSDYQELLEKNLGKTGENGLAVWREFFTRRLWPLPGGTPRLCVSALNQWKGLLDQIGLQRVYERYDKMLQGRGIDWQYAERRVKAWVARNVKGDGTPGSAEVPQQIVEDRIAQMSKQATEQSTRQPLELAGRPSLRMLADAPLSDDEGDRLDFKSYANALAGLIDNPNTSTPLTLAINAPWGAGKTTLAKMIQRRLATKPAARGYYPHVTCWFNAWMHDDAPNLAGALTAEIAYAAEKFRPLWWRVFDPLPSAVLTSNKCRARRLFFLIDLVLLAFCLAELFVGFFPRWVTSYLKVPPNVTFSVALSVVTAAVLLLGKLASVLVPLSKGLTDYVRNPQATAATGSIESARQQLGRLIKQARPKGSRFVIFVDDLERCQPPRPVDVLEVINQLLNHEGVITVIMSDMLAVAACAEIKYKQLAKRHALGGTRDYGRAYLQKIVQLQFDVPAVRPGKIRALIERLATFIPQQPQTEGRTGVISKVQATFLRVRPALSNLGRGVMYASVFGLLVVVGYLFFYVQSGKFLFLEKAALITAVLLAALLTAFVLRLSEKFGVTKRVRLNIDREIIRRLASGESDFERVEKGVLDAVRGTSDVSLKTQLVRERVQRFLEDESELQREAEAEVVKYLPPLPRNAKRMLNRLRLLIFVAHERKMFGGTPEVKGRHLGKWAVLGERWPVLAQALAADPTGMSKLEADAADRSKFGDSVKVLAPVYATDDDLRGFCQSETKLGEVMERLTHFEPAA